MRGALEERRVLREGAIENVIDERFAGAGNAGNDISTAKEA
jgi:hypothetical protein